MRYMQGGRAPDVALPVVVLPLKEEAVLQRGDELLRLPAGVAVISFAPAGQGDHRAMVKIVVPHRVKPVAVLVDRPQQPYVLRLVFRDDDDASPCCGRPRALTD